MPHDAVLKTIELVQAQVRELEQALLEKKRMVNDLCKLAGRPPTYADEQLSPKAGNVTFRSDEFYGKPLSTVVRRILEKRDAAGLGAASVGEIYDAMVAGGYNFAAKSPENAKRGLYVSLAKNTYMFHKLPNGNYGLLAWYPNVKKENGDKAGTKDEAKDEASEERSDAEGEEKA